MSGKTTLGFRLLRRVLERLGASSTAGLVSAVGASVGAAIGRASSLGGLDGFEEEYVR